MSLELSPLFYMAVMLLGGLCAGRVVKQIHLPNVTGYLLVGLLLGPCVLNVLNHDFVMEMRLASDMALAFIAFTIGAEFKVSYLKKVGMTPIIIAICEAFAAVIVVAVSLIVFGFDLELALLLGAIASATAPAATMMVVRQYQAKGPVTETLISVVALDDAAALMAFGFATAAVTAMNDPGQTSLAFSILKPFLEIIGAGLVGALLGFLFTVPLKYFKKNSNRTIILVGFVFLGASLAEALGLSALLLCMCMGAVLTNISNSAPSIMKLADNITPPIFVMFFVASGAELDLGILKEIGLIGVIYVIARVVGKIAGASFGAAVMHAEDTVKKYIGLTLVPQAGVAIGLSLIAAKSLPEYGPTIRAVILCGTLIYELVGPGLTKMALKKAGEIK